MVNAGHVAPRFWEPLRRPLVVSGGFVRYLCIYSKCNSCYTSQFINKYYPPFLTLDHHSPGSLRGVLRREPGCEVGVGKLDDLQQV